MELVCSIMNLFVRTLLLLIVLFYILVVYSVCISLNIEDEIIMILEFFEYFSMYISSLHIVAAISYSS